MADHDIYKDHFIFYILQFCYAFNTAPAFSHIKREAERISHKDSTVVQDLTQVPAVYSSSVFKDRAIDITSQPMNSVSDNADSHTFAKIKDTHKPCVIDYTQMHDGLRKHHSNIETDDLNDTPGGAIVMLNQKHVLKLEDEDENADDSVLYHDYVQPCDKMKEDQDVEAGDTHHDNKAIEMEREETKHDTIDFHALCEIMRKHKVHDIGVHELRSAFCAYADGNKKDALIADTIDAYYCSNDELLPSSNAISIVSLCDDGTRRRAIYEIILFQYFE
eukprot:290719_1